jgi:hypothetical protein
MYKYLLCLLFILPSCQSFYEAKFDQTLVANAITVQEYESVSEALSAFIDVAIEQNQNNPSVIAALTEWKKDLADSNKKVALVAEELIKLARESNLPDQIKRGIIDAFLQVVDKWLNR